MNEQPTNEQKAKAMLWSGAGMILIGFGILILVAMVACLFSVLF